MMNAISQPNAAARGGIVTGAISAPTDAPALKMDVANARSFLGKYSAVVLIAAGKFPASPRARMDLAARKSHTLTEDMARAAEFIEKNYGCSVLLKGGHSINDANDLLYANGEMIWFEGKRIDNPNTHGTGCTLSSAIASNLAKGYDLESSIQRAKDYISDALSAQLDLGQGSGPVMHNFDLQGKYAKEAE